MINDTTKPSMTVKSLGMFKYTCGSCGHVWEEERIRIGNANGITFARIWGASYCPKCQGERLTKEKIDE